MTRREHEERPLPAHPYRDSAIVYGIMAVILVVLAGVTGGSLVKATGAAIVFWLLACAWSWWKFRRRIQERELVAAALVAEIEPTGTAEQRNGNGNRRSAGTGGTES